MSTRFRIAVVCLLVAGVLGCPRDEFEVVQQRKDGGVERTLTIWHVANEAIDVPNEKLLEAAMPFYGEFTKLDDKKVRFRKAFTDGLPADITYMGLSNYADFGSQRSPMGESFEYLERYPGETNMVEVARKAAKLADLLTKAVYAYFEKHSPFAGDKAKLAKIERFLQDEFRDDLLNFGLTLWLHQSVEEESREDHAAIAVAGYFAERGYIEIGATGDFDDLIENATRGAVRKLATAIGYDRNKPLPQPLAELTPDNLNDVFAKGYESIGVTEEEVRELAEQLIGPIFGRSLVGTIVWRSEVEPLQTNGTWDGEKKQVTWSGKAVAGGQLPKVCFARWAFPDETYQMKHLGKVVIREEMPEYNKWYAGLSDSDRSSLDQFVDRLTPGPDLLKQLQTFQFQGGPTPAPDQEPSPPYGITLIMQSLKPADTSG